MRLLDDSSVNNVVGFDLQAVDNWRLRLQIDLDLLDPNIPPAKREQILEVLRLNCGPDQEWKTTADFYGELREKKSLSKIKKGTALKQILDRITMIRDQNSSDLDIIHVWSVTHGEAWGGSKNLAHNLLEATYKTVAKIVEEAPAKIEGVIPTYVNGAKYDDTGNLVQGELIPVSIPELNMTDNPDLKITTVEIAEYHSDLDDNQKLHNALINAKKLSDLPKKYQKTKYEKSLGKGLEEWPMWWGKKIPDPDNEIRVIRWKASLGLVNDTNTINEDVIPPMLKKDNEEEATITQLFQRARTTKNVMFQKIIGIQYIVASEYMIPEEIVLTESPIEVHGVTSNSFFMNVAWRPNRRIIGLREQEKKHNEAVNNGEPPLLYDYFDSIDKKIRPAFKWVVDPKNPKNVMQEGLIIPPHGIDILDTKLYLDGKDHNYKVKNKIIKDKLWNLTQMPNDIPKTDNIQFDRPLLDDRYSSDWRFEEMILGIYFPLIDCIRDYFTDPRTGEFFWKYKHHDQKLDKEKLEKSIAILQTKPANKFSAHKIHDLMTNAFMRGTSSDFKLMELDDVMQHVENIMNRAPKLAVDVLTNNIKNEKMLNEVKKMEQTKTFSQQNYAGLSNNIPKLVAQYKNMIDVYPYAEITNMPEIDDGWYYTRQQPKAILESLGLQVEELELESDRKSLEFYLRFLEYALQLLIDDASKPSSDRKYFVKIKKEEEEEEEEEEPSKPKKKKAPQKPKESTEKELEEIVVKVHPPKMEDIGDSLRTFGRSHGYTSRWGQTDLLNGKGDPLLLFLDLAEALAKAKEFKDNANSQAFPGWIKTHVHDEAPDYEHPEDILHVYAFETKSQAKYMKRLLDLYYDNAATFEECESNITGKVVFTEILQRNEEQVVIIWKSIKSILHERMDEHYKDDLDAMKKDHQFMEKGLALPPFLHSLELLKFGGYQERNFPFQGEPCPACDMKEVLESLIQITETTMQKAEKSGDLESNVRKAILKKEPGTKIIKIEINLDEHLIEIQLEKALNDEGSMAETLAKKFKEFTFEFKTEGLKGQFSGL